MQKKILILDDDGEWLDVTVELLNEQGHLCIPCLTLEKAYEELGKGIPDAYLVDVLVRDSVTGQVTNFVVAKQLFCYIQRVTGQPPKNFYLFTSHISFEDQSLAGELGVPVIKKSDLDEALQQIFA
jgi:CheY-like chemotaxis protein